MDIHLGLILQILSSFEEFYFVASYYSLSVSFLVYVHGISGIAQRISLSPMEFTPPILPSHGSMYTP